MIKFDSNVSDKIKSDLYNWVYIEGDFNDYFYNITESDFSAEKFVEMTKGRVFTVTRYDDRLAAFMLLDEVLGGLGSISYYGFKWVRGLHSIEIGKAYLKHMLQFYQTLIGISPVNNRVSIAFNKMIGMTEIGLIPKACYIAREKKYIDGLLTFITKGDTKNA